MFVLLVKYLVPLDEVQEHIDAHFAFLDRFYREGKFVVSGRRDPYTGGVILANVESEVEAMKIVCEDPFFLEKVADYELIRFTPTRHDPRFAPFVGAHGA